ncbi:ATP-binding protein [Vibrio sagamiensis]|uniref:histidine kinase n=1 Tax=Vibrio sagamiensis NBRC 104589 TaxID=1219064 RepID=A0A511QJR1_9VIBR|nr:DUF3404 domain-containing protein [Vibrio sagamiensis]PNQ62003.1 DUF3404 domain-containing protein [Vibrio agarivorans]GEM77570.1 sensor histidine kinase [Vibrio sagamiensis NBRC 104589]
MIKAHYILSLAILYSHFTYGQNIQSQWQELYQKSWQQVPYTVTQNELHQYPMTLLKSSAVYPNFTQVDWNDLRLIEHVSTICKFASSSKPIVQQAIEFELKVCNQQLLPVNWFLTNKPLHPAGGSFADRYLESHDDLSPDFLNELSKFTTLSNPMHPLHDKLKLLSESGSDALINGYRAWLEGDTLWLSNETGWKAVPASIWQPLADQKKLTLKGKSCTLVYSNLCISEKQPSSVSLQIIFLIVSLLSASFFARLSFLKHKQRREKRFILQLLTHELRTPITSLGLTVDMFRDSFDRLDEETQDTFWRLSADYQRLEQLTENSKTYLSVSGKEGLMRQHASIADWLAYYCEKNQVTYSLNQDKHLKLPYYWLAICLENLIINAKQHGMGEVMVKVTVSTNLYIEVSDHGEFPSRWRRLFKRKKHNTKNMGIGLEIVAHLIKIMNGRLTILRNPTRCIMELPYEHNSAD